MDLSVARSDCGAVGAGIILLIRSYVIGFYNITPETKQIAWKLMDAIALIVVFQSVNGVMTKGGAPGRWGYSFSDGGDVLFLWIVSVPLEHLPDCTGIWMFFGFMYF